MADIQDLELFEQLQIIPLSVDIADYIQSLAANAIISDDKTVLQNTGGSTIFFSPSSTRVAEKFPTGSTEIENTITEVSFWVRIIGTITGTVFFEVENAAGTVVHTFGSFDVTTLTGTFTKTTQNTGTYKLVAGDRIVLRYEGSVDASNRLEVEYTTSNPYSDGQRSLYTGTWADQANDMKFEIKFQESVTANLTDGSTATSLVFASEINPFFIINMESLQEIAALTLYYGSSDTTTEIIVEFSTDKITWTLFRTIPTSFFTSGAYNYILSNRPLEKMQYIRITGTDGIAKVMHYHQIKVRTETEPVVNRTHKHKTISPNDSTLPLNGDTLP